MGLPVEVAPYKRGVVFFTFDRKRQDFTIVSSNETGIFRIHLMRRAKVLKGSNEASFVQFLQMRLATMLKSLGLWDFGT